MRIQSQSQQAALPPPPGQHDASGDAPGFQQLLAALHASAPARTVPPADQPRHDDGQLPQLPHEPSPDGQESSTSTSAGIDWRGALAAAHGAWPVSNSEVHAPPPPSAIGPAVKAQAQAPSPSAAPVATIAPPPQAGKSPSPPIAKAVEPQSAAPARPTTAAPADPTGVGSDEPKMASPGWIRQTGDSRAFSMDELGPLGRWGAQGWREAPTSLAAPRAEATPLAVASPSLDASSATAPAGLADPQAAANLTEAWSAESAPPAPIPLLAFTASADDIEGPQTSLAFQPPSNEADIGGVEPGQLAGRGPAPLARSAAPSPYGVTIAGPTEALLVSIFAPDLEPEGLDRFQMAAERVAAEYGGEIGAISVNGGQPLSKSTGVSDGGFRG